MTTRRGFLDQCCSLLLVRPAIQAAKVLPWADRPHSRPRVACFTANHKVCLNGLWYRAADVAPMEAHLGTPRVSTLI